jgi:hypothetical protein
MGTGDGGITRSLVWVVVLIAALPGIARAVDDDGTPLYPVFENGLWGLIDSSGQVILAPRFQQIGRGGTWIPETWDSANPPGQVLIHMTLAKGTPVTDRVIPVRLDGKLALATRAGDILVHGEFDEMDAGFGEGLLRVESGGRTGFVDERGSLVIPARWERAYPFRNGHAFVRDGGRWGVIDRSGNPVVAPRWDQVRFSSSNWVIVQRGKDLGVVDRSGKVVVPVQYDEIRASPMGPLMPVHDDGRIYYLRPDGEGTVAFEFTCPNKKHRERARALGFFGSHAALINCGDKYGLLDEDGALVLEPEWEDIHNFINGLALVRHKGKQGLIDESGRFVVPLQKDIAFWGLGEDQVGFSRGQEHGYFDREGRVVQTFRVDADHFGTFVDGLAVARRGIKDGYIDRSGAWVIEPRFHRAEPFRGPLAVVQVPVSTDLVEIGYISRRGEAVYGIRLGGFLWLEHSVDPAGISARLSAIDPTSPAAPRSLPLTRGALRHAIQSIRLSKVSVGGVPREVRRSR